MEQAELRAAFQDGIALPEGTFWPLCYLSRVDEPEFGCEGRPEGGPIFGLAYGFDAQGPRRWQIREADLWVSGLDDNMWVGCWQGDYAILPAGSHHPKPLEKALFDRVFSGG